jgi:hypothetical protein
VCRQMAICEQYGQLRQECAVAGNFQDCISAKMGDDKMNYAAARCTNDGHAAYLSEYPKAADCFLTPSQ